MCMLFGISEIKDIPKTVLENVLFRVKDAMQSQNDGFGFAFSDNSHQPYIHRYVEPNLFQGFHPPRGLLAPIFAKQDAFEIKGRYPNSACGALIAHGRTATNDINLANTHPFLQGNNWIVAHNGIVHYLSTQIPLICQGTNDSEHLANIIATYGIENIHSYLYGSIAVCAIAPEGHLVLLRDGATRLYVAECQFNGRPRLLAGTTHRIIDTAARGLKVTQLKKFLLPAFQEVSVFSSRTCCKSVTSWQTYDPTLMQLPKKSFWDDPKAQERFRQQIEDPFYCSPEV